MAKGQKTGGRQKGTCNRLSGSVKEMLNTALKSEIESFPTLINQLEPKDRIDAILKLLPFIIPKADNSAAENTRPVTLREKHSFITSIMNQQIRNQE